MVLYLKTSKCPYERYLTLSANNAFSRGHFQSCSIVHAGGEYEKIALIVAIVLCRRILFYFGTTIWLFEKLLNMVAVMKYAPCLNKMKDIFL